MESIQLNVISTDPEMKKLEARIRDATEAVLPTAVAAIHAKDIEIIIDSNSDEIIPEIGVGGFTETPHRICVWVDPRHENIKENIEKEIQSTIVHELHHVMRNRAYPWPGTLLDDVVGEGLANHFDIEINKYGPKTWSVALSEDQLRQMYLHAEPYFHTYGGESVYYKWMFGSEEEGIPKWTGYALGFKIVGEYLERTGKKASELVNVASSEFLKKL